MTESNTESEELLFELIDFNTNHTWKIYKDGQCDGFPEGVMVINRALLVINALQGRIRQLEEALVANMMGREDIRDQINLLHLALGIHRDDTSKYEQLYAAQQALSWVQDKSLALSPYSMIMGIPSKPEDCLDESHPTQS